MFIITRNKEILTRVKFIAQPYTKEQNTQTQKRHHTSWIVNWRCTKKVNNLRFYKSRSLVQQENTFYDFCL